MALEPQTLPFILSFAFPDVLATHWRGAYPEGV
jgi:hypothetical protein